MKEQDFKKAVAVHELARRNRKAEFEVGDVLSQTEQSYVIVARRSGGLGYEAQFWLASRDVDVRELRFYWHGEYSADHLKQCDYQIVGTASVLCSDTKSRTGRPHYIIKLDGGRANYFAGCRKFQTLDKALEHWSETNKSSVGKGWKRQTARKLFRQAEKAGLIKPPRPRTGVKVKAAKVPAKRVRR